MKRSKRYLSSLSQDGGPYCDLFMLIHFFTKRFQNGALAWAEFGLARIRLWRWLAVTTLAFALFWTLPCLDCGPSTVAPHLFHVVMGFVLVAFLAVCGFLFGPAIEGEQIEPVDRRDRLPLTCSPRPRSCWQAAVRTEP